MKPRTPSDLAADRLPIDLPDDDEPVTPFRAWIEPDRGAMRWDGLAIVFGLSLGLWVVAGLAVWKWWPAIEGAFQ